jgi:DNA repair protein RadC
LAFWISQTGSTSGTIADPRLIFCTALKGDAYGIIVAHSHPSGNSSARQANISLTNTLREAGKFLEIPVLDHLIIAAGSYASFADEGLL